MWRLLVLPLLFTQLLTAHAMTVVEAQAILGITSKASLDDAKKAYRKLILIWHPDRHTGDAQALEHAQQINQAWELIQEFHKNGGTVRAEAPTQPAGEPAPPARAARAYAEPHWSERSDGWRDQLTHVFRTKGIDPVMLLSQDRSRSDETFDFQAWGVRGRGVRKFIERNLLEVIREGSSLQLIALASRMLPLDAADAAEMRRLRSGLIRHAVRKVTGVQEYLELLSQAAQYLGEGDLTAEELLFRDGNLIAAQKFSLSLLAFVARIAGVRDGRLESYARNNQLFFDLWNVYGSKLVLFARAQSAPAEAELKTLSPLLMTRLKSLKDAKQYNHRANAQELTPSVEASFAAFLDASGVRRSLIDLCADTMAKLLGSRTR